MGYTGGTDPDPTYTHMGGHSETVDLRYDPSVVTYEDLLAIFWKYHDATSPTSPQYRSAIYYHSQEQRRLAEKTLAEEASKTVKPICTAVEKASRFTNAENYHQKYFLRQHHKLLQILDLSDEDLITSHVATKLNGYLGRCGNKAQFEQDKENLKLTTKVRNYVEDYIT